MWLPREPKRADKSGDLGQRIRNAWSSRTDDQTEWDADSIAYAVTGKKVQYCGRCLVQCFSGGRNRPAGLR